MKYLKISNDGILDSYGLTKMVSSKKGDDTKIGQFGSGLKYAIAFLLRNHYELRIFAGLREIEIIKKESSFRDRTFNELIIDGKETSFTDEMGMDWELWQAIRELYCNAIDEGADSIDIVDNLSSDPGKTNIFVSIDGYLQEILNNWDNYFVNPSRVLFSCKDGQILAKSGTYANFYFTSISINESRVVSSEYTLYQNMWKIINMCDNFTIIDNIFRNLLMDEGMEGHPLSYSTIVWNMSDEFLDYLKTKPIIPTHYVLFMDKSELFNYIVVPSIIYTKFSQFLPENPIKGINGNDSCTYKIVIPNAMIQATINAAEAFLKECKFDMPYDIVVAKFDKKNIYGTVSGNTIILNELRVNEGIQETVNTIIEEYIHIKYNVCDESRDFQTASINELINYMKLVNTHIL